MSPSIVALIPARAGSKRIPGKNTRDFFGHPLIAYTIHAAKESGIFDRLCVCSDDTHLNEYSARYATVFERQPVPDDQPDIVWVEVALARLSGSIEPDAFAILRPTSPFRTAETMRRAWRAFQDAQPCDSLRAVEPVTQHPYKMWVCDVGPRYMRPFASRSWDSDLNPLGPPLHSRPTQTLPRVYVQNASLEIAWTSCVTGKRSISGDVIAPFFTEGYEGVDLNTEDDWRAATSLVDCGLVALPDLGPQTSAAASL